MYYKNIIFSIIIDLEKLKIFIKEKSDFIYKIF